MLEPVRHGRRGLALCRRVHVRGHTLRRCVRGQAGRAREPRARRRGGAGSFRFVVDEIAVGGAADGGGAIGVQWHVEAGESGEPLPFTRGSSVYRCVGQDGGSGPSRIVPGFDMPEPVVKSGGASLALLSLVSKLLAGGQLGRARLATAGAWGLYVWGLFLSDQLPMPPLLQPQGCAFGLSFGHGKISSHLAAVSTPAFSEVIIGLLLLWLWSFMNEAQFIWRFGLIFDYSELGN